MAAKEHSSVNLQKLEKVFERELIDWVEAQGGLALKMWSLMYAGIPDRIILYKGQAVFIEAKRTGLTPRKLQLHWLRLLNKLGFGAVYLDYKMFVENFKDGTVQELIDYAVSKINP